MSDRDTLRDEAADLLEAAENALRTETVTESAVSVPERLDDGAVFSGFLLGVIIGALWWLWRSPRSGRELRQDLSERLEQDPVADSIAAGKAAAQRIQEQQTASSQSSES